MKQFNVKFIILLTLIAVTLVVIKNDNIHYTTYVDTYIDIKDAADYEWTTGEIAVNHVIVNHVIWDVIDVMADDDAVYLSAKKSECDEFEVFKIPQTFPKKK